LLQVNAPSNQLGQPTILQVGHLVQLNRPQKLYVSKHNITRPHATAGCSRREKDGEKGDPADVVLIDGQQAHIVLHSVSVANYGMRCKQVS
jgi:hypothetical protein